MKQVEKDSSDYYISEEIKRDLNKSRDLVMNKDWDRVFIIDGEEGSGKSLLGLQIGCYLDPTLNLDRVVFTGEDFARAISNAHKNQCVIFDEAFNGLSSSTALSKMNKMIVSKLMECRQKNLFIIIILPTIFLLQKYAAIFRSRTLFHVYATSKGVRGYYRVYNRMNKKYLYLTGAKLYSYAKPYISKSHRFYGKYPLNEGAYRAKKLRALSSDIGEVEKVDKYALRFALFAKFLKERHKLTFAKQSKMLQNINHPLSPEHISRLTLKIP